MSAIAGIVHFNREPVSYHDGHALMQALRKYPADRVDTLHEGPLFFGCLAQWITPESVYERLPYYDNELKLAITADAILDNRNELFNRLQVEHERRRTITDSQLILLAYRKWGQDAPKYFVGDYAFALWDASKNLLFAARDLQGSRTLYYHYDKQRFVFCTAVSPLFTQSEINKRLNETWFAEFLAIPVMIDSTDVFSTVYEHIKQIPPAHSLTISDGKLILSRYGTLIPDNEIRFKSSGEYVEAFREVFQEAVTSKLRTHRQVGATLSGGLDSGAVVSVAAKALLKEGKPLYTYSSVPLQDFDDWTSKTMIADESPYARATARHVGNIKDRYLDLPDKSPYSDVDEWLELLESPYKTFENSYWIKGIYETASWSDVGLLLTGAKGNFTISWGSALDYYALLLKRLRFLSFYREVSKFGQVSGIGRSRLVKVIAKLAFPNWDPSASSTEQCDIPSLIHPDFSRKTNVLERLRQADVGLSPSTSNVLDERQDYFNNLAALSLQGTIGSKLSLRYRLWERDPTCDARVVRFCLSLPFEQYVQNGMGRSLVRRATEHELPDEVRLNVRARGFQGADWVQRMKPVWKSFTEEVARLCQDPIAKDYLHVTQIRESLSKVGDTPRPEYAIDPHIKVLMRSIIVYRFLQRWNHSLKGGDTYAEESMASTGA